MSKSDITKITAYSNTVVARSHNKRIHYAKQEDGNILIELVRMLSKEEQVKLKNAEPEGNQQIVQGKVFVTALLLTETTVENLRVFLNVIKDTDSKICTKTAI